MTERMQAYRNRMAEKGLVQMRIWVEKEDEEFVKFFAKFCREEWAKKVKKRFGRPASLRQIAKAEEVVLANNVPAPKHLYDHHISLTAWIWGQRGVDDNPVSREPHRRRKFLVTVFFLDYNPPPL